MGTVEGDLQKVIPKVIDIITKPSRGLQVVILVLASLAITVLYGAMNRTIWIDEFLHFALASGSWTDTFEMIWKSTGNGVNHGQTGTYMLIDAALLKTFGASNFLLRLPTYLAMIAYCLTSVAFIRIKTKAFSWQLLMLVVIVAQIRLSENGADARPYMFLVSSTVALLAFYALDPISKRRWFGWSLLFYGIFVGALMHPYWLPITGLVALFSWFVRNKANYAKARFSDFLSFIESKFLALGLIAFFAVGLPTWMRGSPTFGFDPFQEIAREYFLYYFRAIHFGFIYRGDVIVLVLGVVVGTLILWFRNKGAVKLIAPITLIVVGLSSSAVFSVLSYLRDYWIMERQWVVGQALVAIGTVWLIFEISRVAKRMDSFALRAFQLGLVLVIALAALLATQDRIEKYDTNQQFWTKVDLDGRTFEEVLESKELSAQDWLYLANLNISQGGPVRPEFKRYYGLD